MAQHASSAPPIRDWLSSALPNAPFVYPTKPRVPSSNRIYTSLVKSIKVQEWRKARNLPALAHLNTELDRPLRDSLAATKPVALDAFRVLAIEANLQHFFDLLLVYCVNLGLHSIYQLSRR